MSRPGYIIIAILFPLVALLIAFGVERRIETCGERFDDAPEAFAGGSAPSRAPAGILTPRPGTGLGRAAWATRLPATVTGVESAGRTVIVSTGTAIGAYNSARGTLRWVRELPGGRSSLTAIDGGVAVVSAALDAEDDRVDTAFIRADGEIAGCEKLTDEDGERVSVRGGGDGLIATLATDGDKTKVVLYESGGEDDRWEREVDGRFESIAVAGGRVVLADAKPDADSDAESGSADAVIALDAADGDEVWRLPAPRLRRIEAGAGVVYGLASASRSETSGRPVAVDARTGKVLWSSRQALELAPGAPFRRAGGLLLIASGDRVVALSAATGARLWATPATPGRSLGDLLRAGPRVYATGGRPAELDARTGRATPFSRGFGLEGALTPGRLSVVYDVGLLVGYRREG